MTDASALQHRKATRFGRKVAVALIVISNVAMLVSLAILFRQQGEFQDCQASYLARDSSARNVRSNASSQTISSLVAESLALSKALDPANQPPSEADVRAALDAISAVPTTYMTYSDSIDDFPYPKYTCGGKKPVAPPTTPLPKVTK